MTDAPFRPFDTALDRQKTLATLRDTLSGADDGELFLERSRSEVLMFDDGRIKTASYDASEGFGLRAVRGEVAGYAHSTDISDFGDSARLRNRAACRGGWRRHPRGRAAAHQHHPLYRCGSDRRTRLSGQGRDPARD